MRFVDGNGKLKIISAIKAFFIVWYEFSKPKNRGPNWKWSSPLPIAWSYFLLVLA